MKRSFGLNYVFHMLYQLVVLALPLLTTPYLSRVLGAGEIGRYSFAGSLASYFVLLATLGTTLYGQRLIARVQHLPKVRTHFFFEMLLLRTLSAAMALGLYLFLFLPHTNDKLLYAVLAIDVLAVALDVSWFYQGMERFGAITACQTLGRLSLAVCVFVFVKTRHDLVLYAFLYACAMLLGHALLWCGLPRLLCRVRRWRPKLRGHLWLSLGLFLGSIAIQTYTVLDKTMIGLITGSALQNGYYEQAQRLIHVLCGLVTGVGVVMTSRVALLWKEGRREEVYALLLRSMRLVLALAVPLSLGTCLVAWRFTPLFFGAEFAPVATLLVVLSPLMVLIGMSNVIGIQLFASTERGRRLTLSLLVGALLNFLLNGVLIWRYGALGAAIASVVAECSVTVVQCVAARHELSPWRILRLLIRYLLLSVVALVPGAWLSAVLGEGIGALLLIVLVSVLSYIALLLFLRDPVLGLFREKKSTRAL